MTHTDSHSSAEGGDVSSRIAARRGGGERRGEEDVSHLKHSFGDGRPRGRGVGTLSLQAPSLRPPSWLPEEDHPVGGCGGSVAAVDVWWVDVCGYASVCVCYFIAWPARHSGAAPAPLHVCASMSYPAAAKATARVAMSSEHLLANSAPDRHTTRIWVVHGCAHMWGSGWVVPCGCAGCVGGWRLVVGAPVIDGVGPW